MVCRLVVSTCTVCSLLARRAAREQLDGHVVVPSAERGLASEVRMAKMQHDRVPRPMTFDPQLPLDTSL